MATYSTDWSEYALDVQPSDWTERGSGSSSSWNVRMRSGGVSGRALENTLSSTKSVWISWDEVDADAGRADCEVLALLETPASSGNGLFRVFGRGAGTAIDGYFIDVLGSTNKFQLRKFSGGTDDLATSSTTWGTGEFWWVRLRINGTSIRARFWRDGATEPSAWEIDVADSEITAAGWVGLGGGWPNTDRFFHYFAVGTAGDTAPGPAGGGDVTATPFGIAASGLAGAVTIALVPTVAPSGVAGIGAVGSVVVGTGANAAVAATGVSAAGLVGAGAVALSPAVSPGGVSAMASVGNIAVTTASVVTVAVTGASASAAVGSVAITGLAVALSVTGVSAALRLGRVTIFHWTEAAAVPGSWSEADAANDVWTEASPAAGGWS